MTVDDIFKYSGGTTMNQGKEYKNGALMGAIAALFSFGLSIYIISKSFKYMTSFSKVMEIGCIVCMLFVSIFAFIKLEKVSFGFLLGLLLFSSIESIKYLKDYNNMIKIGFDSGKYKLKVSETLYYLCNGFSPYVVFAEAVLGIILFILIFTTPDRKGLVSGLIVFGVISTTLVITALVCYIVNTAEFAERIKNYWLDIIVQISKGITDLLMIIGISKSVAQDDVRMYGQSRITPNNGMYGIPYSQRPQQSSQFGFGTGMNVYNTPQNPAYDQRGSFNQRATFGGQPNMNSFGQPQMGGYGQQQMNNFGQPNMGGYNQNMNYNQPQNMGNFGQPNMNGFGQPQNMGNFGQPNMNSFGQPQMGGYNQNVGGFNPNMNYNQPQNTADFGGFGQPDNSFGSQTVDKPTKIEEPAAPKSEPKEAEPVSQVQDTSIYDKPDNSVEFEQPQSFTSTDL